MLRFYYDIRYDTEVFISLLILLCSVFQMLEERLLAGLTCSILLTFIALRKCTPVVDLI